MHASKSSKSPTLPIFTLLLSTVSLAILLSLSGCGNDKSVTFKSAGMTHTFSEGEEDIPKELQAFIYPASTVAGATDAHDAEGEEARFLTLSTTDAIEQVADWYQSTLQKNGWAIDSNEKMPRMINMSGHLKDMEINVVMAEDGKKTTISVSQGRSVEGGFDESELENFTPNQLTPPTD
ncbi:MAG: hypothetical protein K8F91_25760 [Candidatus Obscuribacterales bacterium]|nr:hypothetical protein [Candidatus Obscuribacterales bacterium]